MLMFGAQQYGNASWLTPPLLYSARFSVPIVPPTDLHRLSFSVAVRAIGAGNMVGQASPSSSQSILRPCRHSVYINAGTPSRGIPLLVAGNMLSFSDSVAAFTRASALASREAVELQYCVEAKPPASEHVPYWHQVISAESLHPALSKAS